jgi:hypothetical protein
MTHSIKRIVFVILFIGATTLCVSATPTGTTILPHRFEAAFELYSKVIFMKAKLNDIEEWFILDSGAPTLVLNADNKAVKKIRQSSIVATGVGGNIKTGKTQVTSFDWNGIKVNEFDAITMSLNHLEKQTKHSFAGLIGYTLFKDYELTFDYKRRIITFIKVDDHGNLMDAPATTSTPLATIPFEMKIHIPVFSMTVAGKAYKMGLDCGAGNNLLYKKFVPDLENDISEYKSAEITGAGKKSAAAGGGYIKTAYIGAVSYPDMAFFFEDGTLNQLNTGYNLGIDGLLGYEFLNQHTTSVNFKKGELHIYAD